MIAAVLDLLGYDGDAHGVCRVGVAFSSCELRRPQQGLRLNDDCRFGTK